MIVEFCKTITVYRENEGGKPDRAVINESDYQEWSAKGWRAQKPTKGGDNGGAKTSTGSGGTTGDKTGKDK